MFCGDLEHLSYETFGSPVTHGDQAAGAADALEFGGDNIGAWGEHGAEHGEHDIEAGGFVGKFFGVAFDEFDFQILVRGAFAGLFQEIGRDVESDDFGSGAGRRNGLVSGAASYVEDFCSWLEVQCAE